DERLGLFHWFLTRANRLLYEATDPANFTDGWAPDQPINPVAAFEHLLSLDRLLRKTLLSMTIEDPGTARQFVFEAAELYDAMSDFFGHAGPAEFFKRLFDTAAAPALLADRLRILPSPFGPALAELTSAAYARI